MYMKTNTIASAERPAHQHSATYVSRHHVITGEKERNFTQVNPYFASAKHRRRVWRKLRS